MNVRIQGGVTSIRGGVADFDTKDVSAAAEWLLPRRLRPYRAVFKRLMDVLFVLAALPIVLPTVLLLAVMIWFTGSSPFYMQKRLGRHGRVFRMWKLRTMVENADAKLEEYLAGNAAARREWDAYQKLTDDPRITPLGAFLRKSSLDELPQLWNVLKGDMSLVGPRPMMPEQKGAYPGHAYFDMRPGVTGTWQISDRNASTFAERAAFDDDYDRKLSLLTDLKVLLATVGVVVCCTGR